MKTNIIIDHEIYLLSMGHKVKYYLNIEETETSLCDNLIQAQTQ